MLNNVGKLFCLFLVSNELTQSTAPGRLISVTRNTIQGCDGPVDLPVTARSMTGVRRMCHDHLHFFLLPLDNLRPPADAKIQLHPLNILT